jgi:hypothetical protein
LTFDDFKLGLRNDIFKCISLLNGSFLEVTIGGFLKDRVKTIVIAPRWPPQSLKLLFIFRSIEKNRSDRRLTSETNWLAKDQL